MLDKNELNHTLFSNISDEAKQVGNKTAHLRVLHTLCSSELNATVPAFYAITDEIIKKMLATFKIKPDGLQYDFNGWREYCEAIQKEQDEHTDEVELTDTAKRILNDLRNQIIAQFDGPLVEEVDRLTASFASKEQNHLLMVRSTGEEDSVDLANPGGNESIAAVQPTSSAISHAIGLVVASYFSEKSLKQRLLSTHQMSQEAFMPVLLQSMVGEPEHGFDHADDIVCSGVMYTGKELTRIQVAPGHCTLVVESQAPCDTFDVTQENLIYSAIAQKQARLVPEKHGLDWKANPKSLQNRASIPPEIVIRLTELGRKIEQCYGIPMDVEFVYSPKQDMIYLVQARPIPASDVKTMHASSTPPGGMNTLKLAIKNKEIQQCRANVIAPAGFAAKVITDPSQILICRDIETALNIYLGQTKSPVHAVIVRDTAPATSHAAAQFTLMQIPVLQITDEARVKEWANQPHCVLVVDPQRNQILDYTAKRLEPGRERQTLEDERLLADGLFAYPPTPSTPLPVFTTPLEAPPETEPVPAESTLALGDQIKRTPYDLLATMRSKIARTVSPSENLLTEIDRLETTNTAEEAIHALGVIRNRLTAITQREPAARSIYPQAMLLCEEIERNISHHESEPSVRETHLRLVAQLNTLVRFQGHRDIYSNSILQIMKDNKQLKMFAEYDPDTVHKLDKTQLTYLAQFLKLADVAFTEKAKNDWIALAVHAVKNGQSIQKLTKIVQFYTENHLESDFLNQTVEDLMGQKNTMNFVLDTLYDECLKSEQELISCNIKHIKRRIQQWEDRIPEWHHRANFDALFAEYKNDMDRLSRELGFSNRDKNKLLTEIQNTQNAIEDLENDICISKSNDRAELDDALAEFKNGKDTLSRELNFLNTSPQTKHVILQTALNLTDMMDRTIKSTKSSPDYQDDPSLLVKRFATLLDSYHRLMKQYITCLPDEIFRKSKAPDSREHATKEGMLSQINQSFQALDLEAQKGNGAEKQLLPSNNMSISACTVGSSAAFYRQYNNPTLEDLFSLMHQNILASISFLNKSSMLPVERLPEALRPLITQLNQLDPALDLLSITHATPVISIEYNQPLRNHSGKYTIEYNMKTQQVTLKGHLFGLNHDNRMDAIAETIADEGRQFGYVQNQDQDPCYSEKSKELAFKWVFHSDRLERLAPVLSEAIASYGKMTFASDRGTVMKNSSSVNKRLQRFEALSRPINEPFIKSVEEIKTVSALIEAAKDPEAKYILSVFFNHPLFDESVLQIFLKQPLLDSAPFSQSIKKPEHIAKLLIIFLSQLSDKDPNYFTVKANIKKIRLPLLSNLTQNELNELNELKNSDKITWMDTAGIGNNISACIQNIKNSVSSIFNTKESTTNALEAYLKTKNYSQLQQLDKLTSKVPPLYTYTEEGRKTILNLMLDQEEILQDIFNQPKLKSWSLISQLIEQAKDEDKGQMQRLLTQLLRVSNNDTHLCDFATKTKRLSLLKMIIDNHPSQTVIDAIQTHHRDRPDIMKYIHEKTSQDKSPLSSTASMLDSLSIAGSAPSSKKEASEAMPPSTPEKTITTEQKTSKNPSNETPDDKTCHGPR